MSTPVTIESGLTTFTCEGKSFAVGMSAAVRESQRIAAAIKEEGGTQWDYLDRLAKWVKDTVGVELTLDEVDGFDMALAAAYAKKKRTQWDEVQSSLRSPGSTGSTRSE